MKKDYYVGIDIGATNTKYALITKTAAVKAKKVIDTPAYKNEFEFVDISRDIVHSFMRDFNLKKSAIRGIGIGAPGAIDSNKGVVHYFVNIKGWREVPLKKMMEKKIGIPAFIDNDANVMVLGEYYYGAGKGAKNMIGVTLGSGVGGGLVLDGKLFRGTDLAGGELGHVPVNVDGPGCQCGGWGCVEAYVGNKYIVRRAINEIKGKDTIIRKLAGNDLKRITPRIIYLAARRHDKAAVKILKDTGIYLGVALTGIINLLNPELIAIGGGVANAGRFIFDGVKETVKKRGMKIPAKTAKIVKAELGEDAGVIGAIALVREKRGE